MNTFKRKLFLVLEVSENKKRILSLFNIFIFGLIIINIIAYIVQSEQTIYSKYKTYFDFIEYISVIIFTIEYIIRVWIITENPKYQHPVKGRLRYMKSTYAIIDLLAILPFYITILHLDTRILRILWLLRLFRLAKIVRYIHAIRVIEKVIKEKIEQLVVSMVFIFFLLLFASSAMYYIEGSIQPKEFGSIPKAMWWGVETLTTVGYGDVYPVTLLGKIFAGIIAILGIGLFALPAGILASGFGQYLHNKEKNNKEKVCPHCGKII
ncbi:MAG: ion transporter [Bacteroidales bacterium]